MYDTIATERVFPGPLCSATQATVHFQPAKFAWTFGLGAVGLVGGLMYFSWGAVLTMLALMVLTLCLGHSIGLHRLLIHRSFRTHRLIEYILVYLGTLVGMEGPLGMIRIHETRDWQQRQRACHSFSKHDQGFWKDAFWQLGCEQRLAHPPVLHIEPWVADDRFYRFLQATWRWQQLPAALVLLAAGGWGFVFWGIGVRVTVSLAGHWAVGHFVHRTGERPRPHDDLAADGYNLRGFGLVTFGECWHNNHHAFPRSARMGRESDQMDPSWWIIWTAERLGLVWAVRRS